jgi:hypothetical protein
MRKHCKECPHIIRNKHNDVIIGFANKHNISHNCHMTDGVKNLWKVNKKTECYGAKLKRKSNEL